jgi:hypothetical protein
MQLHFVGGAAQASLAVALSRISLCLIIFAESLPFTPTTQPLLSAALSATD